MTEADEDRTALAPRRLSGLVEPFHDVTYYAQEVQRLNQEGYSGWWHAYFAYRAAPMGAVAANVVTAAFYNFAPRMVDRAVPGVWQIMDPDAITSRRLELVDEALRRIFGPDVTGTNMRSAAGLARSAIEGCDIAGRPVFAAYAALPWPDEPHLVLWHACTLLREHRGDGHNIALAAAGVNGVECHVLKAAHGHGNVPTILGIRGWTPEEWQDAVASLAERGFVTADGDYTDIGREARADIERHTDELASEPTRRLGDESGAELEQSLTPLVAHLINSGEVFATWPPPTVMREPS